jgi:HAD superfamily hydrolase (TIGR01509 family)
LIRCGNTVQTEKLPTVSAKHRGTGVVIFDCNGVLVDSEPIANAVLANAFTEVGVALTSEILAREFHGRRLSDICSTVEAASKRQLPPDFARTVAGAIIERLGAELRAVPHAAHALRWIRGPKAVASSSPIERIRLSLEATDLLGFFEKERLFSADLVAKGKPAPDLFVLAAEKLQANPAECIVVEDSAAGVAAAHAAGMKPIGFVGRSRAEGSMVDDLEAAGARTVIADLRALQGAILDLRGW